MKKPPALALALAICACSPGQQTAPPNGSAAKGGYALRSNVPGASLVQVTELPAVTSAHVLVEGYCAERFVKPASAAARLAEQKGWRVLQEAKFHQLQAVLIVRGLEQMTSGRCASIDANIAFFDGGRLVGVLYPKGKDAIAIGAMELVDNHLRIWSPDPAAQGQVDLDGTNLTFDRITGSDRVCNGKYRVPAVFGQPYPEARRTLIAAGWRATPSTEEMVEDERLTRYRRRFPEFDYCAGTGYGECSFTLTAADDVTRLTVTTLGDIDDARVSSYSVSCGGTTPGNGEGP